MSVQTSSGRNDFAKLRFLVPIVGYDFLGGGYYIGVNGVEKIVQAFGLAALHATDI